IRMGPLAGQPGGKAEVESFRLMFKFHKQFPLAVAVALVLGGLPAADPLQQDLKERRGRAMEKLGPESVAVFWSAPPRVYSNDVDYEYRQDSNLLYLTGIDREDTRIVRMPR